MDANKNNTTTKATAGKMLVREGDKFFVVQIPTGAAAWLPAVTFEHEASR